MIFGLGDIFLVISLRQMYRNNYLNVAKKNRKPPKDLRLPISSAMNFNSSRFPRSPTSFKNYPITLPFDSTITSRLPFLSQTKALAKREADWRKNSCLILINPAALYEAAIKGKTLMLMQIKTVIPGARAGAQQARAQATPTEGQRLPFPLANNPLQQ